MNQSLIEITHISKADAQSEGFVEQLRNLAAQWQNEDGFWSVESCLDSIKTQSKIVCASANSPKDEKWSGWYFANCYDDHAELLFIFTSQSQRGKGIARILLDDLINRLKNDPVVSTLSLEVRPSNLSAIRLYESAGFKFISRRKNYYRNGEDALVYQLNFNP